MAYRPSILAKNKDNYTQIYYSTITQWRDFKYNICIKETWDNFSIANLQKVSKCMMSWLIILF